jgi:hypothetical protein
MDAWPDPRRYPWSSHDTLPHGPQLCLAPVTAPSATWDAEAVTAMLWVPALMGMMPVGGAGSV